MARIEPTPRTTIRRRPPRGAYDREAIEAILDEGFLCNIAVVIEGRPLVLPTSYAAGVLVPDYIAKLGTTLCPAPAFAEGGLDELVGRFVVGDAHIGVVPLELAFKAQRQNAEQNPLSERPRDGKIRTRR